jgi:thiol-disulfide isomerase/thioredoxin
MVQNKRIKTSQALMGSPGVTIWLVILGLSLFTCSTKNLLFTQKFGSVFVDSQPPGAIILLDHGLTQRTTPDTLTEVPVGDHVISVLQDGYLSSPESLLVGVEEDKITSAEFVLLETSKGSLKVSSNLEGAVICLDHQPTSESTPHVFFNSIPVGEHIVSIFKEGHSNDDPAKEVVDVVTSDTVEVNLVLSPAGTGVEGGDITPDFELEDDFGFFHRLYAYRGFVTVVNFWAESCPNCMKELPYLQEIYEEYLPDSLLMFGLNYEDGFDFIRLTRQEKQLTFTLLRDVGGSVKDGFIPAGTGTPVTFILDRSGQIGYYRVGFDLRVPGEMRNKLDELFGKQE